MANGGLFNLMLSLVLAIFVVVIGYSILDWWLTLLSPTQKARASVISKRIHVSGGEYAHTRHFCTFELDDGRRVELKIRGRAYGMLAEGDEGIVIYQRNRFRDFERFP